MSLEDELLNELTSVGRVESEGEFSLDRDKAREKMRRFQLADPRSYVLELVQAATLKGATAMRFDIDPVEMVVAFDGQPFTLEDFDDIYSAVFTRRREPAVLARKQLALGLNAAMALEPARVTVESGDGSGRGARLELRPGEETHDEFDAIDTELTGTRIVLRERFRAGTVVGFFKNLAGEVAEEHHLRRRCVFSQVAIDLEGRRVDRGLHVPGGAIDEIPIEADGVRGVCGITLNRTAPPTVHVVKDGVWITSAELEVPMAGFVAVVEARDLSKDVSQADIVRDAAWQRMIAATLAGWRDAVVRLAERVGAGEPAPDDALDTVIEVIAERRAVDRETRVRLANAIEALPIWMTTVSTVDLRAIRAEVARRNEVFAAPDGLEVIVPKEIGFVLRLPVAKRDALVALFGKHLNRDAEELERIVTRERNRLAWRRRRAMPDLPSHHRWLARRRIETDTVRAEVGMTLDADRLDVRLIKDGCLLESVEEPGLLGLYIVVEAAFEPDETFTRAERDDVTLDTILLCIEALVEMLADIDWANLCGPPCRLRRHPPLAGGDSSTARASEVQAARERAVALLELLKAETGSLAQPVLRALGFQRWGKRLSRFGRERMRVSLIEGQRHHPLAEVPVIPRLDGTTASLVELAAARDGGRLGYVRQHVDVEIDTPILVLDNETLALLTWVFGKEALRDAASEVERLVARERFRRRPVEPIVLEHTPPNAVRVSFDDGQGVRGEVAVWPSDARRHRRHEVALLHDRRRIDTLELFLPGGLAGVVESEHVEPTVKWDRVKRDEALDVVHTAVARAYAECVEQLCARLASSLSSSLRAFLREVATMVFVTPELRALYEAELGADKVEDDAWSRLTALPTQMLGSLASAVRGILNADDPQGALRKRLASLAGKPAQEAVIEALFPDTSARTWADRARAPITALANAELFTGVDGSPITLAALAARASRSQPIYVVEETRFSTVLETDSPVVDLDSDRAHEVLFQIFGRRAVRDGSGLVERARRRTRHESRPRLERIELAEGSAMVKLPIDDAEPLRGEVGLEAEHPGDGQQRLSVTLRVHVDGRFVDIVSRRGNGRGHLVAAVDDSRFSLTRDLSSVADDIALSRAEHVCTEHHGRLITELLERLPGLDASAQASAHRHLLDFVVNAVPSNRWHRRADKVLGADALLRRIFELPLLATLAGSRRSLGSLLEHGNHVEFLYADSAESSQPAPEGFDRQTVLLDAFEEARLAEIFDNTRDMAPQWQLLAARARHRAVASAPTRWRDDEVLLRRRIEHDRLSGEVVLPLERTDDHGIELCAEGKVLAVVRPSRRCPGAGQVSGAGVQVADDWSTAGLDSHALSVVQRELVAAYGELAQRFVEQDSGTVHAATADRLCQALVSLHRASNVQTSGGRQRALYERLKTLPLLPTKLGVRITFEQALETRPPELSSLGLWRPPPLSASRTSPPGRGGVGRTVTATRPSPPSGGGAERSEAEGARPLSAARTSPPGRGGVGWTSATTRPSPPSGSRESSLDDDRADRPERSEVEGAPEPTPSERLTDAVRDVLRLVRKRNRRLLDEPHLDPIAIERARGRQRAAAVADRDQVRVDAGHATVREALARHADEPIWTMLVASSVYTALNIEHGAITDSDELEFHRLLAGLACQ